MQSVAFVALLCCVLVVSGAPTKSEQIEDKCLAKYHVSPDMLAKLHVSAEVLKIQADENIKCLTKCIQQGYGIAKGSVIQVEHVVAITKAQGRPDAIVRANLKRCAPLYKGRNTCDEAWTFYQCFCDDK